MCRSFPGLLIGRTAVPSGKDLAFVAYDQFLSTGILQPLSRGEVRCGIISADMVALATICMSGSPPIATLTLQRGAPEPVQCDSTNRGNRPSRRSCHSQSCASGGCRNHPLRLLERLCH